MKHIFFLVIFLGAWCINANTQDKPINFEVRFQYDDAGNREKIIVVELFTSKNTIEDSTDNNNDFGLSEAFENQEGIDDKLANGKFTLYPNPTHSILYYNCTVSNLTNCKIIVSDASSKVVMEKNLESTGQINLSNLASGFYFIRVTANGDTSIWKIIKE